MKPDTILCVDNSLQLNAVVLVDGRLTLVNHQQRKPIETCYTPDIGVYNGVLYMLNDRTLLPYSYQPAATIINLQGDEADPDFREVDKERRTLVKAVLYSVHQRLVLNVQDAYEYEILGSDSDFIHTITKSSWAEISNPQGTQALIRWLLGKCDREKDELRDAFECNTANLHPEFRQQVLDAVLPNIEAL